MRLIIGLLLSLFFIPGTQASTREGLRAAFDEFHYATTVEWDQMDPTFYQHQFKQFAAEMRTLFSQGLTREELLAFLKAEVNHPQVARDIESILTMVQINKMSETEAMRFIRNSVHQSLATGSSWAPAGKVLLIVGAVIATLFITYILLVRAYEGIGRWVNNWGGHQECRDEYICREDCYQGQCQTYCNYEVVCR